MIHKMRVCDMMDEVLNKILKLKVNVNMNDGMPAKRHMN